MLGTANADAEASGTTEKRKRMRMGKCRGSKLGGSPYTRWSRFGRSSIDQLFYRGPKRIDFLVLRSSMAIFERARPLSLSLFFVLRRPTQRVLSTLCKYDISIDSFRPTESVVSRSLKKYRDTVIDNEIPGKLRGEGTSGTRRVRKVW